MGMVLLTVTAAGLRLWQVNESLWIDELHTSWVIYDGLEGLPDRAAKGNYSPVYFILPWLSTQLLGQTELALRLPSIVAGTMLVPFLYFAVVGWTGSRGAGLLTAMLATLDPNFLFFSLEARPFALVQWLGLIQIWLFSALLKVPQNKGSFRTDGFRRAGFIALSVVLFYLHYTTLLLLLAEFVAWGTLSSRKSSRPNYGARVFAVDLLLIALACLPALPHLMAIYERRDNWKAFIRVDPPWWNLLTLFPLLTYVLIPMLAIAASLAWKGIRHQNETKGSGVFSPSLFSLSLLAICWLIVPLAAAWTATWLDVAPLFFRRYLMVASCAPLVLAGILYAKCSWRVARAGIWIALLGVGLWGDRRETTGILRQFHHDRRVVVHSTEGWQGAIEWIHSEEQYSRLPVLVYSGLIEEEPRDFFPESKEDRNYHTLPVRAIYNLTNHGHDIFPAHRAESGRFLVTADQIRVLDQSGGGWFLIRAATVSLGIESHKYRVEQRSFGGVSALLLVDKTAFDED